MSIPRRVARSLVLASLVSGCGPTPDEPRPAAVPSETAARTPADVGSMEAAIVPASEAPRRGIQSVYWLGLDPAYAKRILDTMKRWVPAGTPMEIEFSAAQEHDYRGNKHQGWANATKAISLLKSKGLVLAIDFGHHTMENDSKDDAQAKKAANTWGKRVFTGVFKSNWKNALFVIQVANEDTYSCAAGERLTRELLRGLRDAWMADRTTKKSPFPYASVRARRTNTSCALSAPFKIDPKTDSDAEGFTTEHEYHFPDSDEYAFRDKRKRNADAPPPLPDAGVVSNDGQIVYRQGTDPNPWAQNGTEKLLQGDVATFTKNFPGKTLLLWHPSLHRWQVIDSPKVDGKSHHIYRGGKDSQQKPYPKADTEKADQDAFLALLKEFMKSTPAAPAIR